MRSYVALFALAALCVPANAATTASNMMPMPKCMTGDTVVWLDAATKTYYKPGAPQYGKTKHGKYACASKASALGMHVSKSMMMDSNGSTMKSHGMAADSRGTAQAPAAKAMMSPEATSAPSSTASASSTASPGSPRPAGSTPPASPGPNPVPSVVRTSSPSP